MKPSSNHVTDPEILDIVQDDNLSSDPEHSYQKKDENRRLMEALDTLPFSEKQVLVMRFFNEMKLEEIAAAMNISRSSVKRYIASGQNALRQIMKG